MALSQRSELQPGPGRTLHCRPDHDDLDMSRWAKCEYMHMLDKLGGDASRLVITNIDADSARWITDATTARGYNNGVRASAWRLSVCLRVSLRVSFIRNKLPGARLVPG